MKAKKLLAMALSLAMVFTSFTIPTFADEIIDEPIAEEVIVEEEVSEEAPAVEEDSAVDVTIEEIPEEIEVPAAEEEISIMAEGKEGDTFNIVNAAELSKYLGDAKNTSKSKGKYALASSNSGKDVTLKLMQDVTISANTILSIPGDRQIHIDLNGHDLDAATDVTITLEEMTADGFKGWQSLYIDNSDESNDSDFGDKVKIVLKGTEGTPAKQSLLRIGKGVCSHADVVVDGGIATFSKGSEVDTTGKLTVDKGLANVSASIKGTVSGNNIALTNAEIRHDVTLGDGSSVTGNTTLMSVAKLITVGDVTINTEASDIDVEVKAGTATMTGGRLQTVTVNGANAKFVMNGGRIEKASGSALTVTAGKAELNAGIVAYKGGAAVSGTFNSITSTKPYIIDGKPSDSEEVRTSGEIYDSEDLEYAFANGGDWVLADDIYYTSVLTLTADELTITNKSAYTIERNSASDIIVNGNSLTLDVNIYGGSINAKAPGSKLTIIGGNYVTNAGNAIKVDSLDKLDIKGGTIVGESGYDYYMNGGDFETITNCSHAAISDVISSSFYNNAGVIKNGKEVIEFSADNQTGYVLLNKAGFVYVAAIFNSIPDIGVNAAAVSMNAVFRSSGNATSKNVTGLTIDPATDQVKLAAAAEGTDVIDVTYTYKFAGDEKYTDIGTASATIDCTKETDLAKLADSYNATLESTSGTMNAYLKEYKVYFDFHRKENEGYLINSAYEGELVPTAAVINTKAGSTFDKYFTNTNGMYPVKYDSDKDMYYVALEPKTEGSGVFVTTKLAQDGATKFSNLNINVGFAKTGTPTKLEFSVPMTKYAYNAVVPESGNPDQAFTLRIDQSEPGLTFDNVEEGNGIKINPAYTDSKSYWIDFTEMPEVEDSRIMVSPGVFTGQDIIDASDDNIDVASIKMASKSGMFNSNGGTYAPGSDGLTVYYMGAAASEEEGSSSEGGEETAVRLVATYKEYFGTHDLKVPVTVEALSPSPKLEGASFTVAQGEAVSDIPLAFTSNNADDLGAISSVEVVKNPRMFSIVEPSGTPVVKTANGNKFTYDGYKLSVQKISDKKGVSGTIKVHFNGIKDNAGVEYTKTYNVTAKPVETGKFKMKVKSSEVLYIGTASTDEAVISVKTTPDYANGSIRINKIEVKSKSGEYVQSGKISASVNGLDIVVKKNTTEKIPKDISGITIYANYYNADGQPMCTDSKGAKDQKISVKIDKNESVAPTKTNIDVVMNARGISSKLFYNNKIEADNTAKNMTKTVSFGGKNYFLDSVSVNSVSSALGGSATADAVKLFNIVSAGNGKVKVSPRLSALKSGLISVGDVYSFKLNLVEAGTGANGNTAAVNVNIKIEKDASKFKVGAKIDTKGIKISSSSAHSSAKFTIRTTKPFYGMKIESVEVDRAAKNFKSETDYFDIESINGGQGFTASSPDGGTDYSDFRVVFKNGKVPTKSTNKGKTLITGSQKVPVVVKYTNGLEAHLNMSVNITK